MKLILTYELPGVTFNGNKTFKGKAKFIKMINDSDLNIPLIRLEFTGDEFDADDAVELLKSHLEKLEGIDLSVIIAEVKAQFEEGLDEYSNFDSFFAAIDVSNSYEDDWSELSEMLKPLYLLAYRQIKGIK
jgi:hypothetical protein